MHMDYKTAAWRMDMARGVKATDPVRGTVLMHRFREGRRESGGKRYVGVWGVWGERLAGYWKARCSFREAGGGGEGGEGRRGEETECGKQ